MKKIPFVSVIIPCYQEKAFIEKCINSLLNGTYPRDRMEILVFDGGSTDGTRETVEKIHESNPMVKLRDNPRKFQVFAMNSGLKEASGDIIVRCDAHAHYEAGYVEKLAAWLVKDASIGSIGGVWVNIPPSKTSKAEAISLALGSFLCVGTSRYRIGIKKPAEVDTVPFGAWRRDVIDSVGFFDESNLKAEDLDFNFRIRKSGYRIILDPDIKIYYYTRDSYSKLFRVMFQYGYWKNYVNKKLKKFSSLRQLAPPAFVLYLAAIPLLSLKSGMFLIPLFVYLPVICGSFLFTGKKDFRILPLYAFSIIASHTGYGLGYLKGLLDFIVLKERKCAKSMADLTR